MNPRHTFLTKISLFGFLVVLLTLVSSRTSAQNLNWGSSFSPSWSDGQLSGVATVAPGITCNVTITNTEPGTFLTVLGTSAMTPAVSPTNTRSNFFRITGANSLLELDVDWASRVNGKITVQYEFSQPVNDLTFYVGDIDKFSNNSSTYKNYMDRVTFVATNGVLSSGNPAFTINAGNYVNSFGNSLYANPVSTQGGNAGTYDNNTQQGTVLVSYTNAVKTLTITYDNYSSAVSNPSAQAIAIGNMTFSVPIISGRIWHDINNSANNTFSNIFTTGESGTNVSNQLYVNLIDALGLVYSSVAVAPDGSYSIAAPESTVGLRLQLSDIQGVPGDVMPASELPNGWQNTSPLTTSIFNTGTSNISGRDFGVNQLPESAVTNRAATGNPGAFYFYSIPASAFQGGSNTRDFGGGTVTQMRITSFPTNTNYININGTIYRNGGSCAPSATCVAWPAAGVTVPYTNNTGPSVPISIDPIDGAVTAVISFAAIDNAGGEDPTPGTVSQPFTVLNFSGFLFDDADGNALKATAEPKISGTAGTNSGSVTTGAAVYAILADAGGIVIEVEQLQANGNFLLDNVPPSANGYTLRVTTSAGTVGLPVPAVTLPSGWVLTGESNNGTVSATIDGILIINTGTSNLTNLLYGWERPPTAQALAYNVTTPPVNTFLTLNGTGGQPGPLAGNDAEDGIMGSGKTAAITSLPTNGNQVWYNGVRITNGANGTSAPSTTNPFVIANYNPALLQVRATGLGSTGIQFGYSFIDNAGVQGAPQNYSINWAYILPVHITSFTARAENESSVLNWKVDNQEKFDRYEVEYASEIGKFALVGTVKASTAFADNYQFTHHNASSKGNKAYYRLKLIDIDGQYSYSETTLVKFTNDGASIFPTILRAGQTLYVQAGAGNNQSLQLIDNNGRIISQQRMNGQSVNNVNTSQLRSGVYIVRLQTGTTQMVQRIVVQP